MVAKNKSDIELTADSINSNLFHIAESLEMIGGFDDSSLNHEGVSVAESLYQIAKALTKIAESK